MLGIWQTTRNHCLPVESQSGSTFDLALVTLALAMHTRQELMRILGLSYKQIRARLGCLARGSNLLDGQVVKGPNGRLEYSPAVLQMLRDLAPLAQGPGKDNGQAARELSQKIRGNVNKSGQGQTVNPVNPEALK